MSNGSSIPSSVNMSGDLSRQSRLTSDASHIRDVGPPLSSPAYRPNLKHKYESEGVNANPLKCAIVLGTLNAVEEIEYRIGRLRDIKGLWEPLTPADTKSPVRLRSDAVRSWFGDSKIYADRNEAVLAADKQYPNNNGIKVIVQTFRFPS